MFNQLARRDATVSYKTKQHFESLATESLIERGERGEATLDEAAATLAVSQSTIRRLIVEGALPASQHCKGAPWIIRQADLQRDEIRRLAELRRLRRPPPDERQQNLLDLSMA